MAPPGRPNTTSTASISRLLMRAWAPVNFMVRLLRLRWDGFGKSERPPVREVVGARGEGRRALGEEYYAEVRAGGHRRRVCQPSPPLATMLMRSSAAGRAR